MEPLGKLLFGMEDDGSLVPRPIRVIGAWGLGFRV